VKSAQLTEPGTRLDALAESVGAKVVSIFELIGSIMTFVGQTMARSPKFLQNPRLTIEQMSKIGITSLPLVSLTSVFTGAVTAWQAAYQFSDYIPLSYLGVAAGKAIMINLGPVLTALVVAGRIGAAMAAELGTMRVTEQIDAMECLSLDPFQYLFMPRFLASVVMLPILVILSSFIGLMGAALVARLFFGLDLHIFFNGVKLFFMLKDIFIGLFKAVIFGAIISGMGCYYGNYTSGGAQGVGESTKKSVVASSVWILVAGYIIDGLFL
jgi:phospholipid/cholesterol/gamma-HCH transport system permease protein